MTLQRPVERLIFIHALLPRPGQSLTDQLAAEPDMFQPCHIVDAWALRQYREDDSTGLCEV